MLLGDGLEHILERHGAIGRFEGVAIAKVDLVLTSGDLVMAGLDVDAKGLERRDHVLAHDGGAIGRGVKVAGLVIGGAGDGGAGLVGCRTKRTRARGPTRYSNPISAASSSTLANAVRGAPSKRAHVGSIDVADQERAVLLAPSFQGMMAKVSRSGNRNMSLSLMRAKP